MRPRNCLPTLSFLSVICFTSLQAQETPSPVDLMDFLKPEMQVGIQSSEGTLHVTVDTYSPENFKLAQELKKSGRQSHPASEIAAESQSVREQLDRFLETNPGSKDSQVMVISSLRKTLGVIEHVGNDFVLIRRSGEENQRFVLARAAIMRINLDASPVRFLAPRRR